MIDYRTVELPCGIRVNRIMSFFTTCFDCGSLVKNRRETYPFWAMIYTHRGGITFRIGDQLLRVGAGELIFYPPSLPHSIVETHEKSWEVSFATFQCEGDEMLPLAGKVFSPDLGTADRIRSLFRFGGKHFYNLPSRGEGTVGMHCKADILELCRLKHELEAILARLALALENQTGDPVNEVFEGAVEYMRNHLGEQISLDGLARELGVSVSTLKNAFRKESGGGVNKYYIEMKLSHASKLLCESNRTVGEISDSLGFASQFYFSEQFKQHYGLSPTEYRRRQRINCRELM